MEHPKRLPDVLDGVEHYSQVMSRHGLFAFQQVPYLLNQSFILISNAYILVKSRMQRVTINDLLCIWLTKIVMG